MRRGRLLIFLVLIVVVGLGVLFAVLTLLAPQTPQTVTQQTPLTEIYYAAQNIPQGAEITPELLGKFSIPSANVAEVMFTVGEESNLVGKFARLTLEPGVVITSSMVGDQVDITGPAYAVQIPTGMAAVTIPANRLSTVGYGVNDGARVNVIACLNFVDIDPGFQTILPNYTSVVTGAGFLPEALPVLSAAAVSGGAGAVQGRIELDPTLQQPFYMVPSEAQRPRMACQMILQDVKVMKLGNFSLQLASADPNATPSPAQAQQQASPDIVTLIVNPQDSISLNFFVYNGAILTMTLRNPSDRSLIDAQVTNLSSLLAQYGISLPSKLPYGTQPRVDILVPPVLPNDAPPGQ
jgi:pilus assembly protein CpaB